MLDRTLPPSGWRAHSPTVLAAFKRMPVILTEDTLREYAGVLVTAGFADRDRWQLDNILNRLRHEVVSGLLRWPELTVRILEDACDASEDEDLMTALACLVELATPEPAVQ